MTSGNPPVPGFIREKLVNPILLLLRQGIAPDQLALAVALGFSLGIFPVIGATTIMCALFAHIFKLNHVAIQLVNYFTYPLQLALFIPFFALGAWIFGGSTVSLSLDEVVRMLSEAPWQAIQELWWANLRAVAAWCIIAIPLTILLFSLLRRIFRRLVSSPT